MPHVTLCRKLQNLSESVVLVPKSVPDLSTSIFHGCEILFDLITIPTWYFATGNGEAELLNKKCVRCTVVTSASQSRDEQTRAAGIILHLSQSLILLISPKIAGAQSFTARIKKPPKYRLVAGTVKEQQSR